MEPKLTGPELRDQIRADDAFHGGIFEAAARLVKDVRETLRAHGKPDLSVADDDCLHDAIYETVLNIIQGEDR